MYTYVHICASFLTMQLEPHASFSSASGCDGTPCANGGTCSLDGGGAVQCACVLGYSGADCSGTQHAIDQYLHLKQLIWDMLTSYGENIGVKQINVQSAREYVDDCDGRGQARTNGSYMCDVTLF